MPYYQHKKTGKISKWTVKHFEENVDKQSDYTLIGLTWREAAEHVVKPVKKKRGKK